MDIIPHTLNNGGITADYCDECAINNTIDELTDNLHNPLLEESKGRYAVPLAYGGETFPFPGCGTAHKCVLQQDSESSLLNTNDAWTSMRVIRSLGITIAMLAPR
ncbi:hypothetical protein Forpe1208_v006740 [Fusarium oxysporum f. sp. rapae]|uniref:Uncharacterized protein n=1 Tax=Fusarium oxysporum f. sp. rapae TaxID=485398 RepID=A0A8J5PAC0_FUSOX|nr:hypothetical protein Forpe1208_v006740 [Fusarium oxysporum f. sp. rapae]